MRVGPILLLPVVLLAAGLSTGSARADDRAAAQQLFEEGKALMKKGDLANACPKFEAAAELSQTPGVRLNLALCWAKQGRTASAWARFEEALGVAERTGDAAAAEFARKGLADLEAKLSYLTITVRREGAPSGLEVTRDGEKVPEGEWGTQVPVDPGDHLIAAQAPGKKSWTTKVRVGEAGARESVAVPSLEDEEKPPPAPEPAAPPPPVPASGFSTQRTLALVAGGLGIVGVAVGSYFGLETISKKNDYETHVGPGGQCLDATCETVSHDAYAAGTASTIAFIAGGALLATGAVLWLTSPARGKTTTARILPTAGDRAAGVALTGSW